jgi:hypothetical protein
MTHSSSFRIKFVILFPYFVGDARIKLVVRRVSIVEIQQGLDTNSFFGKETKVPAEVLSQILSSFVILDLGQTFLAEPHILGTPRTLFALKKFTFAL